MKRLKNILLSKKTIIIISLFLLLYITYAFFVPRKSKYSLDDNTFICTVENIYIKDYYKLDLSCKEKIIGYSYNELDIEIGDVIKVTGNLKEIESYNNFNIFNYKNYMNNEGGFYNLNIEKVVLIRKTRGIYKFKNYLLNRIANLKSFSYVNSLVLGDKSYIDENILSIYKSLGIMHIFAISGMHLNILINTFNKIFRKKNIFTGILLLLLLFLYYLLIKSVSLLRAFIYYLISCINNKFNISLTIYHKLFYLFAIMIFINPYFVFSSSFLYSYFISSFLIVMGKKINSLSNYFLKLLFVSFLSFIIAFPLNIYFYYEVNIFSLISNLFAVPYVSFILFPLCLLVIIFPFLDEVLFVLISNFQNICVFLTSFNILLIFKKSLILTLLYYLLFLFIRSDKKGIIILIFLLLVHYNYNFIFKSSFVNYIDVHQGDSILIHNGDNNILIDTGGVIGNDLSSNILIPLFKSYGIKSISSLVITHGDFDHMGEAINLVNNFKVEKVIFNCGPYNNLEKELIKVLDKKKISYYSCIKELNIDKNELQFLQIKEYDNENDNSNVIYTELNGYKFMFMGDASIHTEKEIIDKYNLPNIDVLKVGHHGSRTSSGKEFINEINPKYSIISVGKNNRYGHPNKEALNNLSNSKIYRTDEDGSIMFEIKNNKLKIETCSP